MALGVHSRLGWDWLVGAEGKRTVPSSALVKLARVSGVVVPTGAMQALRFHFPMTGMISHMAFSHLTAGTQCSGSFWEMHGSKALTAFQIFLSPAGTAWLFSFLAGADYTW